jgi:hypothetical protein
VRTTRHAPDDDLVLHPDRHDYSPVETSCDELDITSKRPREGRKRNSPLEGTSVLFLDNFRRVDVGPISLCLEQFGILEEIQKQAP